MFAFLWPFVVCVLIGPWLVRRWLKPVQDRKRSDFRFAIYLPFFDRLNQISSAPVNVCKVSHSKIFPLLGWLFLVLACMRPVWLGDPIPVQRPVRNIVLAMDVSGSMGETDFTIQGQPMTRLEMLKRISTDFIQQRRGDNLGLVIFGSEAYTYAPLSPDVKNLLELVSEIGLGIAGEQTALGDALALSVQTGVSSPAESQMVILLSDGYANAGQIEVNEALKLATNQNVKVYTVGIGSDNQTVQDFFGRFQVNPSLDLDEATLQKIAHQTKGRYFRAKTSQEMSEIYHEIDRLEPVVVSDESMRPQKDLFYWPLMMSLLCFLWAFWQKENAQ